MSTPKRETITVQVDAETKEKLRALARESCRSLSGYVRQLLRLRLREQERSPGPRDK